MRPPAKGTALAALAGLPVKGRAPKTGYSRDEFGSGWGTLDGCDTRQAILRRDFARVRVLTDSCTVLGGRFTDPYTGDSSQVAAENIDTVDVDHR